MVWDLELIVLGLLVFSFISFRCFILGTFRALSQRGFGASKYIQRFEGFMASRFGELAGLMVLNLYFLCLYFYSTLQVISSVFGSTLWTPREDLPLSEYPSPEFLKYRIIISTPFPKQDKGIPRNPSVNRKQKVLQGSLSGNSNGVPSSNSNPNMNSNSTLSLNLNGGNGPSLSRETSLDREKERNSFERETTRLSEVLGALNPFKGSPSRAEKEGEGQVWNLGFLSTGFSFLSGFWELCF